VLAAPAQVASAAARIVDQVFDERHRVAVGLATLVGAILFDGLAHDFRARRTAACRDLVEVPHQLVREAKARGRHC